MSNMVVNTNVLALNSHRSLKGVGTKQAVASARLSSGLKINSAADDAAGLAISEKMRSQIRGLDMASKNAQDAISLIQTAEGGMQEIDDMVQRIRELVVYSSNDVLEGSDEDGTYSGADRQKVQDEIDQLVQEIDDMANRVEFNKKKVINGEYAGEQVIDSKALDDPSYIAAKDILEKAKDSIKEYETALEEAEAAYAAVAGPSYDSSLKAVDDVIAHIEKLIKNVIDLAAEYDPDIDLDSFEKLMELTDVLAEYETIINADGNEDIDDRKTAVDDLLTEIKDAIGDMDEDDFFGVSLADAIGDDATGDIDTILDELSNYIESDYVQQAFDNLEASLVEDFPEKAALETARENLAQGQKELAAAQKALDNIAEKYATNEYTGGLYFQVGANADQGWVMSIGSVDSEALGIGDGDGKSTINVLEDSGIDITGQLDIMDKAITYVTTERSKLGAAQNRLEYTIKSLDISSENLSAAESRIRDTDMAKEMMNVTQANVLQQAATSMLAQANQAPQNVLQLLR